MSVFRTSAPTVTPTESSNVPDPVTNNQGASEGSDLSEPLEVREESTGKDIVLEALGIDDDVSNLPSDDKSNLQEVKNYVLDIIKQRGLSSTVDAFKRTLIDLKGEMGLDDDADPSVVLDRIGGVVKAWKNISFITNPKEKRSLFMKLARLEDSKEMNKMVFQEMERYQVWR